MADRGRVTGILGVLVGVMLVIFSIKASEELCSMWFVRLQRMALTGKGSHRSRHHTPYHRRISWHRIPNRGVDFRRKTGLGFRRGRPERAALPITAVQRII